MKKIKKPSKKESIHKQVKRHAKLAVVPHTANQFRPHMVRWYGIISMVMIAFIAFAASHTQTGSILGVKANVTAADLLADTNAERVKAGEQPLHYDEQLSSAAFLKAQDMLKQQYWAHTAPDGTTPWQWFAKVGYNYAYAGENLAKNFTTTDATVAAWMASAHHRENILNTHYTDVGFAVVDGVLNGEHTTLVVALYGQPASMVAGVMSAPNAVAAEGQQLSFVARLGVALQTMSPAVLGSIIILLFGAFVALGAHVYRRQLPPALKRSWRYHHGLYKAIGLTSVIIMIVTLYSGGQI